MTVEKEVKQRGFRPPPRDGMRRINQVSFSTHSLAQEKGHNSGEYKKLTSRVLLVWSQLDEIQLVSRPPTLFPTTTIPQYFHHVKYA